MERAGDADPSFRRAVGIAAGLLATAYLIFSAVSSHLAPLGNWTNHIFGHRAWDEWDPGGPYVDAAHQIVWGGGQLFEGHPGTVLLLLLSGLQHLYYAVAGSGTGFSFTEFTARNLPAVFVLSKLMMTVLHLLSCWVAFLLTRRLLRDERAAAFAAFGYATSLPVVYYLSRISVEPLVVICFGVSLLAIWRYQDLALEGRVGPALRFAALAAATAASGAVTKLNFLAPLLPFLALYVLLGGWREQAALVPGRTRALGLLVFSLTAAGLGLFYSQFIDWEGFFRLWKVFTYDMPKPTWTLAKLLPGFSARRAFLLCELAYIGIGAVGWVAFLRGNPEQRMRALWVSAYAAWGLLLFVYRVHKAGTLLPFHYFHLSNVVVAVFFGYAVRLGLGRLGVREAGWRAAVFGLLGVTLVHATTLWMVVDSRLRDAELYAPNRELHRLIEGLEPGQRLGCIGCGRRRRAAPEAFFPLHSVGWKTPLRGEAPPSRLAAEFESLFVTVERADLDPRSERTRVDALRTSVVVLDAPAEAGERAPGEPAGAALE